MYSRSRSVIRSQLQNSHDSVDSTTGTKKKGEKTEGKHKKQTNTQDENKSTSKCKIAK
jgi:hypothetical protein